MNSDDKVLVWGFFGSVVFIGGVVVGQMLIESAQCEARWKQSGFESSWGPIQGCLVKVNGRWLPASTIRDVELR